MPKQDELKNRLEELFSDSEIPHNAGDIQPPEAVEPVAAKKRRTTEKVAAPAAKPAPAPQNSSGVFRALFEKTNDAILLLQENLFVDLNQAAIEMFRFGSKEQGMLRHPSDFSPEFQPDGRSSMEKANEMIGLAMEKNSHRFEWVHRRADGEEFPAEVLLTQIPYGDTLVIYSVVRDITERKKLELERAAILRLREEQVRLSTQLAQDIASAKSLDDLYQRVVTDVKEKFGYYYVQFLRYDPAFDAVRLISGYGEIGKMMLMAGHQMPLGKGLIGVAAETGETVIRTDLINDPDWRPNHLLPLTRGEIAVPVKFGNQILGVLDVQSEHVNALDENDQILLEGLCGQIAIAIENQSLLEHSDKNRQRFELAVAGTNEGVWDWDIPTNIVYFSPRWKAMLGFDDHEIPNEFVEFEKRLHREDHDRVMAGVGDYLAGKIPSFELEFQMLHKDGNYRWILARAQVVRDENGAPLRMAGAHSDITARKQAEEMLNKRVQELNCLSDIGHKIDERPPMQEFLTWVCSRIPEAMQHPDICVAAITLGDDVYGVPETLNLARKMVGGIRINNELIGQVEIAYKDDHYFLDEESAFIGAVVGRISSYLESHQLLEQVQQRSEELGVLNEMGRELAAELDLESICEIVYNYSKKLMEVPSFFIALYDETSQMIEMPLVYSLGERIQVPARPIGNAMTDYVLRSGVPLLISDHVTERIAEMGIEMRLISNTQMAESWLGVPINYGGKVLGAIVSQSISTPGLYGENDKNLLSSIASQAASAIENSRSFEQTRLRSHELAVLNEMGQKLTLLKNDKEILQTAYQYSSQLMDVTNFFVMYYDAKTGISSFPLVYFDGQFTELPAEPLGRGLSYHIITTHQPVLLSDHVTEQMQEMGLDFVAVGDDDVAVSWLGVPLSYGEEVFGVISVQSIVTPGLYTKHERDLLLSISSLTAIALENARSIEETNKRSQELAILNDLGQKLGTTLEISAIGEIALKYVSKLMNTDNFYMATYDENKEEVSFIITTLDKQRAEMNSRPLGNGLTDYIIRTRQPLLMNNNITEIMQELGIEFRALGDDTPSLSWLGVPVIYSDRVLAVLAVQSTKVANLFIEVQRDLLTAVANHIAVAMVNIHQYGETQKALDVAAHQARELAIVADVSAVASSILDVEELLTQVVSLTQREFNLYHCHVFLMDADTDELRIIACGWEAGSTHSGTHGTETVLISQEQSLVARAARTRKAVVVNDVQADSGWLPNPLLPDTAAELAVPMLAGERVLGVLDVQARELNRFTDSDILIHTTLASQIAVAVQNAHQYQETQAALGQAETLYSASDRIVRANNIQEILTALVQTTALIQADRANIFTFSENWGEMPPGFYRVEAAWERSGENPAVLAGTTFTRAQMAFETYVQRDAATYILDTQTDRRLNDALKASFKRQDAHSIVIFPILTSDQWIGLVMVQSSNLLALSDTELRQINTLIGQAATVLASIRLRQDMESRLQELLTLQRTIARESWSSYLTGQGMVDWGYLYDRVGVQAKKLPESDSKAAVPLLVRNQEIGRIGIQADLDTAEELSDEDIAMLHSVAEQLSQALERARLLEQTQKSAVELQTVAQVSSATSTILNPEELLQSVVDLAKNSFGLYHAHVYLMDMSQTNLVLTAGAGETGRSMVQEGWSISMDGNTIVTRAAGSRQGQIVNDVRSDPSFLPNPLLPETAAEMAIPIIVGQQVIGVFDVQSTRVDAFSSDDLRTFTTLASQTGVALQNARLFAEQSVTVERLRELDHLKSSFLANMSHELRTPLNSILGFTQVILEGIDGPLTDYMVADLQLVEKNGQHLLNLINEVLDMAKIESGRLTLTLENVDLRSLLQEVFETTSSQARDKQLYLQLDDNPEENLEISVDQMRLRQVLLNLTSNAIKFTDEGGITVSVHREDQWVHVRFKDTGIGIPTDKLEMIFEAFSQVDTSTTRKAGGTGLGLPISRRLIEMHGGKLWAESTGLPGDGSVFCIDLPVHASTNM